MFLAVAVALVTDWQLQSTDPVTPAAKDVPSGTGADPPDWIHGDKTKVSPEMGPAVAL
jgi:hypothetical protein